MTTAVKNKSRRKAKKARERKSVKSTISWSEDFGEVKEYPTKYSVKQLNNRLDFTGLENKLERILGLPIPLKGKMVDEDRGRFQVDFSSENLVEHIGILRCVMKEFYIHDWSNNVVQHGNGDIILNLGVHFRWEFKDGGSNGHELFWCCYNFDRREWSFGNI